MRVRCRFCRAVAEQRETERWWCTNPECNAVRADAGFWVRLGERATAGEPLPDEEDPDG